MKAISLLLAAAFVACGSGAEAQAPLVLEAKIPLGEVRGRIDHMAFDPARRRLFVAELENDSVAVVDLAARKVFHVITDMKGPQGLGYLPSTDTLYAANGGDGSLRMFHGEDYRNIGNLHLGEDADNVRVDAEAKRVFVGYGSGALAVIDAADHRKISDIALTGHPESFQLDRATSRIYVNDPTNQAVVVVDRATGKRTATWPTGNGTNFPMALEEIANHVLVVFRRSPRLVAFAAASGEPVANAETCGDADDVFVDARRRRVYVSCGDGFVDVLDAQDGKYGLLARIGTVAGARTSLFVPDMNRLLVAARAAPDEPAAIWVFRAEP